MRQVPLLTARASESAVLERIRRLPHGKASFKQLLKEMNVKGGQRAVLETTLARLVQKGELIELRGGQFVLPSLSREYAVGRLRVHREGYAFLHTVYPIAGVQGDIFIPQKSAEKAMHGDRVVVRVGNIGRDGKADGEIYEILERAHDTIVGEFRVRQRGNFVVPSEERIQQWIEIPEGLEVPPVRESVDRVGVASVEVHSAEDLDGMIVNVELLEYPEDEGRAVGRVIEVLGHPDDFGVDVEVTIRKHHLPHEFPPEVLRQARSFTSEIPPEELAQRRDFRELEIVTIDGETARDFDDAVWVEKLPNGHFTLQVHIADVSHYVQPGSPIDREAYRRGTSVYFPDRAIPMLPLELSTEICSLKPQVDRLVLSALLELDHRGDVVRQEFVRGVIRSAARMTYTKVHLLLEGDAALREEYASLVPRFELMRELALVLNRKRVQRGSIDFDLPEPLIEFGTEGEMTGVSRAPRNIAHRIIEEFMLSANEAVAGHLEARETPSLYRIHEMPDPKRVLDFQEVAVHFGHSLEIGGSPVKRFANVQRTRDGRKIRRDVVVADENFNISSRVYQKFIATIEGKPEERILNYLLLRSLKQARYHEQNEGHFALAAKSYTHFTSPIRRYPDLMIHRILKHSIDHVQPEWSEEELHEIAGECSHTERRASEAERELVEWKKVRFMIERVGEEFPALVINATRFGMFVELETLFIEGLVPMDTLPGDRYTYHENSREIIGERSRRTFRIGEQVVVRLDRVDEAERRLQFSLVEPERPRKRRRPE